MEGSSDAARRDLVAAARAAWPELGDPEDALVSAVLERAQAGGRELTPQRGAELVLAARCAGGDARAIAALEQRYFPELARLVMKRVRSTALRDEVLQLVRERLFTAQPEIADFQGAGPLGAWLRIVTVRIMLRFQPREERSVALPDAVRDRLAARDDPELRLLEERYGPAVAEGLREAFAGCGARDRGLLRYRYVDGCSIDKVATIYAVHRATAARWLSEAEEHLVNGCLESLARRFHASADDLKSVLRLIRSRIDLSVQDIFASR